MNFAGNLRPSSGIWTLRKRPHGSAEANKQLTQKRVDNVKTALTGAGVDASRIATVNFGEAYPVTDNSNPQARELNRRVEITLAE